MTYSMVMNAKGETAMQTVYYTKRFTSGPLTGLSVNTSLTLDTTPAIAYARFRIGTTGRDALTGSRFTISDFSFQNYSR